MHGWVVNEWSVEGIDRGTAIWMDADMDGWIDR